MERTEAKKLGLKTYDTGRPCKNGHSTYRYTQSGTCAGCIAAEHSRSADPNAAARREARAQLVQVKLRVFDVDMGVMKAAAYAFGALRYPMLQPGDVYPGLLPTDQGGGTALYKFNCHAGDVEALRSFANGMVSRGSVDGAAVREAALRAILAGVEVEPPPPWKP